jgi:hypothetical protein
VSSVFTHLLATIGVDGVAVTGAFGLGVLIVAMILTNTGEEETRLFLSGLVFSLLTAVSLFEGNYRFAAVMLLATIGIMFDQFRRTAQATHDAS